MTELRRKKVTFYPRKKYQAFIVGKLLITVAADFHRPSRQLPVQF